MTDGGGPVVVAVGPLAGTYIEALCTIEAARRPRLWAVAELPLEHNPLPLELLEQIEDSGTLCVAEEHVARGSFASELALHLMERGISPRRFARLFARAHHYDRYGSQDYLRKQSHLDPASLLAAIQF